MYLGMLQLPTGPAPGMFGGEADALAQALIRLRLDRWT